jgi:hypothetical protein
MPTSKKQPKKKTTSKAGKSRAKKKDPKQRKPGTFLPNDPVTGQVDPRINRTGQNAKYTDFHRLLSRLAEETVEVSRESKTRSGKSKKVKVTVTLLENILRDWLTSGDYNKQAKAIEYLVGKVPDELRVHSTELENLVLAYLPLLTDGQMERLQVGDSKPAEIISELLDELKKLRDER